MAAVGELSRGHYSKKKKKKRKTLIICINVEKNLEESGLAGCLWEPRRTLNIDLHGNPSTDRSLFLLFHDNLQ